MKKDGDDDDGFKSLVAVFVFIVALVAIIAFAATSMQAQRVRVLESLLNEAIKHSVEK